MQLSRRKLLLGLLGGAVALPAAYYAGCPSLCERRVAGYIAPSLYNIPLGKRALATVLNGMDAAAIEQELRHKLPWYYAFMPARALREATMRDYYTGEVCEVDGWVLARVTLLVCALAALEHADVS